MTRRGSSASVVVAFAYAALLGACSRPRVDARPLAAEPARVAPPKELAACPAHKEEYESAPWEHLYQRVSCVRSQRARVTVSKDDTDTSGFAHFLHYEDVSGAQWTRTIVAPVGLALRVDDAVVVLDLKEGASLWSTAGDRVWESKFPYCGAVESVAVAHDHAISFSCGFSLLRLDPNGALRWQKWPFGNSHVRGPWVDREGTLYVSGDGSLAALGVDGEPRWKIGTGTNRWVHDFGWRQDGDMVFITSMAEMHSRDDGRGVHYYYPHEPNEFFQVARNGTIVRREQFDSVSPVGGWPTTLPFPEDGSHRLSEPLTKR